MAGIKPYSRTKKEKVACCAQYRRSPETFKFNKNTKKPCVLDHNLLLWTAFV
jgi:hypothetical protein